MLKLPVGIQTFAKIRKEDFLYVDKTKRLYQLAQKAGYYFLSRPRRFGKSLLLSTLKSLFLGQEEWFKGLWIEDRWDWSQTHPVIHLGFSSMGYHDMELEKAISLRLTESAVEYGLELKSERVELQFRELIKKLHATHGPVVILIDEYDKPLIDYLGPEVAQAKVNQRILKRFYSVIKDADPYLRFVFITGVSKFSKVSLFSDLNNLHDLTLDTTFADLVGITQQELEENLFPQFAFVAEKNGWTEAEMLAEVRRWYNGYSWDAKTFLYNPFSLLSFFMTGDRRNYWFETGTPTFLLELMREEVLYEVEGTELDELAFSTYNIERLRAIPILFQTGYLTLKEKRDFNQYVLDYPNKEVRDAMYGYLIGDLRHAEPSFSSTVVLRMRKAFFAQDTEALVEQIQALFAHIPYELFLADREAYYHSLLYLAFRFLGSFDVSAEVQTHRGRIDAVVHTPTDIYVMEFKLDAPATEAMAQIHERGYFERFLGQNKRVRLLALSFSSEEKGVSDWLEEVR